jgi:hypothetical protein
MAEHAFASAATQLNLLDLVTAGDWLLRSNRCRLPALQAYTRQVSPVAGQSPRVVPPDWFAPGWTRRERPRCGSAWCWLGCLRRNAIWSWTPTITRSAESTWCSRSSASWSSTRVTSTAWTAGSGTSTSAGIEDFTVDGYLVIRMTGAAMRRALEVVCRVDAALRSRGYRGPAPSFLAEWRSFFEPPPSVR